MLKLKFWCSLYYASKPMESHYKQLWLKEKQRRDEVMNLYKRSLEFQSKMIDAINVLNAELKQEKNRSIFNRICCSYRRH